MNKKTIIVAQSNVMRIKELLDEHDVWEWFDLIVVRDEDYEEAVAHLRQTIPEGKSLKEYAIEQKEQYERT